MWKTRLLLQVAETCHGKSCIWFTICMSNCEVPFFQFCIYYVNFYFKFKLILIFIFPLSWSLCYCNFPLKYSALALCAFSAPAFSQTVILQWFHSTLINFALTTTEQWFVHVLTGLCVCVCVLFSKCAYNICLHWCVNLPILWKCVQKSVNPTRIHVSVHLPSFHSSHPALLPLFFLLPWLQGSPGFCTPGPTPTTDSQRSGEHAPGQGHAHHHQVKAKHWFVALTIKTYVYIRRKLCSMGNLESFFS